MDSKQPPMQLIKSHSFSLKAVEIVCIQGLPLNAIEGARSRSQMLRDTISKLTKIPVQEIEFEKTPLGKPFLKPHPALQSRPFEFSLSHTEDWLAIAASFAGEVGIDIELKDRKLSKERLEKIAQRYFSPEETQSLVRPNAPESQQVDFLNLWTRKEAILKCLGIGIAGHLATSLPEWQNQNPTLQLHDLSLQPHWPRALCAALAFRPRVGQNYF